MATAVTNNEADKLDIWNDLDTDSNEIKLQKKQARWEFRKFVSLGVGLVFFMFTPAAMLTFWYINNPAPLETLKPVMIIFSSIGCICIVYSFDYVASVDIRTRIKKTAANIDNNPFIGPLLLVYWATLACFSFIKYYYYNSSDALGYFKINLAFVFATYYVSQGDLKKIFN